MCGLIALIYKDGAPPNKRLVKEMTDDLGHRGPDDEGYYFGTWFGLGHKRLSIIALSHRGHQPMLDRTNQYVIIYNGELYNYRNLRNELASFGMTFDSDSDTEVILAAYIKWGPECLKRFIGMFAFVLIDLKSRNAFVARDQLGIKPIYICETDTCIAFSSEIKSFRHLTRFEVNTDALYEQFLFRYVCGQRTIFKDILRLPAGSYMQIPKGRPPRTISYYDVADQLVANPQRGIEFEDIEQALQESIHSHTVSDVGYNIQLSGGLDSSYITAVLAREYQHSLHTFSVELEGFEHDESAYQQHVSKQYHTEHHRYAMGAREMAENLPLATWHMDMPIIHTSCVFLMLLCRYSREHSKVMLTGEGADELFGGYGRYDIPRQVKIAYALKRIGLNSSHVMPIGKLKGLRNLLARDLGSDEQNNFGPEAKYLFSTLDPDLRFRQQVTKPFPDLLRKIIISDQKIHLISLLERQDKMSMAMSVETRVPYCVFTLFDSINRIKPSRRITPRQKIILKKLAERYFSSDFVYRNKVGFFLPVADWLRDFKTFGSYLDLLTDTTFKQRGYYNIREVENAISSHLSGLGDRSKDLMNLIKFEIWHRMFIDNGARDPGSTTPTL